MESEHEVSVEDMNKKSKKGILGIYLNP